MTAGESPASWLKQEIPGANTTPIPYWRFETKAPKARLLICHGYFANRHQVQGIASRLAGCGFEVLVMELRGHGQRPGPCTFGLREADDALAIIQWAENQSGPLPLGLLGFSMGATVMCQVAKRLPRVQAVIADSVYAKLFPVLCRGLWQERHVPAFPFVWCTWLGLEVFLGARLNQLDSIRFVSSLRQELLLIEGDKDLRVPRRSVDSWYAQWAGKKERWCEPDAGHVGVFPSKPEEYAQRAAQFFERMIR